MSNTTVTAGKVVLFHYTLQNDQGQTLDTSSGRDPLVYLHGANNIVPGLESQIDGKTAGDSFKAVVPPEQGYGVRQGQPQAVPRDAFPAELDLQVGMPFMAQGQGGQQVPVWIAEVREDVVMVDPNHPLAGETLHFDVEIVNVRDATPEEVQHGHPHGPDGQHSH